MTEDPGAYLQPALDWVARYLGSVRELPVAARVSPGQVIEALPAAPPVEGQPLAAMLDDLDAILVPAITHWNSPRFLGYFGITGSAPGIAGEMIAAALNVNGMLWRTCPALTELEEVATAWLAQLLGLPDWFGLITDTASTATFTALAAARHRVDPLIRERGMAGSVPMTVYASDQAHSSVDKAVLALGMGTNSLRKVGSDAAYRMDPAALESALAADRDAGFRPAAVVATLGTTAATAIDPLPAIADICARHQVWLHVDGAYGATAAALPELRWIVAGAEQADSLVINPHKWLFVPMDCSVLYLHDPEATRAAFSVVPDYLHTSEDTANLMDFGIALGRRFRALKLWMVLRSLGSNGVVSALREHLRLAQLLAGWVEAEEDFELCAPVPLSVVNLRCVPAGWDSPQELDRLNLAITEAVNAGGTALVSTARIGARRAIHVAIGNLGTNQADVAVAWQAIRAAAQHCREASAVRAEVPGTTSRR